MPQNTNNKNISREMHCEKYEDKVMLGTVWYSEKKHVAPGQGSATLWAAGCAAFCFRLKISNQFGPKKPGEVN